MSLTLFDIESAWMDLIQAREEAEELIDPAEREAGLIAVDNAIAEYVAREVSKVDGIRAVCRRLKLEAEAAEAESDRQRVRMKRAEDLLAKIKICAQVAIEMTGKKRIEGKTGYLLLKGNGGVRPLQVDGWDSEERRWVGNLTPLPPEYVLVHVKIPVSLLSKLAEHWSNVTQVSTEPNQALIREALVAICPECDGALATCKLCAGTGKQTVPGARLLERGQHVEVKP